MSSSKSPEPPPARQAWIEGYEHGIDSMRSASKWVIGALAGVLLAATSLSGFGRLDPDEGRFWLAIVAAAIALGSIGWIVYLFLQVQTSVELNWYELTPEQFAFVREYEMLTSHDSFVEFLQVRQQTQAEYARVRNSIGTTPLEFPVQHNYDQLIRQQDLLDKLIQLDWEKREVETVLGWRPVQQSYQRARKALLWFGIPAAIATIALVWAANPPETPTITYVITSGIPTASPIP